MSFEIQDIQTIGKKIVLKEGNHIIARARIYLIHNDLHNLPYAILEDVYVEENFRGKGYGAIIVQEAIKEAKRNNCYKIIGTSRHAREKVHEFYKKLGFDDYGKEFRINFD
tara:strand:- start:403 stop:735 length:333 start_codon:yes stop_codon:yes gene_type:complete